MLEAFTRSYSDAKAQTLQRGFLQPKLLGSFIFVATLVVWPYGTLAALAVGLAYGYGKGGSRGIVSAFLQVFGSTAGFLTAIAKANKKKSESKNTDWVLP